MRINVTQPTMASAATVDRLDPCQTKHVVSFIIPALNEEKHIGRCLDSIKRLDLPDGLSRVEIIVVDNQSSDDTVAVSRARGAQVVEVSPGNVSRARNAGVRAARGAWLAFVDADCELPANWLSVCGAHLRRDPRAVAAAGVMRKPNSGAPWIEKAWHRIAQHQNSHDTRQVRWLPAFNLLIDRAVFEAAGGYDESLTTCEDCALGYKLADVGRLLLDARAQVTHLGESRSLGELFRREAWRSRGNLRLALMRPMDWWNWMSLAGPLCLVLGFLLSIMGTIVGLFWKGPVWPWLGILVAILGLTVTLVFRKTTPTNLLSFAQLMTVFATYLAGRTAGLLWPFRRVER